MSDEIMSRWLEEITAGERIIFISKFVSKALVYILVKELDNYRISAF